MKLTRHFDLSEFDCHNGAPVPAHAIGDVRRLCYAYLEPLRTRFGPTSVLSGYRTSRYNAQVGGAPGSWHVYRVTREGAAADVRCAHGSADDWYAFLDELRPGGLGRYSLHVHVDNRPGHARW